MELECSRYPGASTIGSQLLDETRWLANPGNPAMSPYTEGNKGTCHTGILYTVESREGRGRNKPAMLEGRRLLQQMHEASMCMWTTEDH